MEVRTGPGLDGFLPDHHHRRRRFARCRRRDGKAGGAGSADLNYIGVPSVDACLADVTRLGGKVLLDKTTVPKFGYLAMCEDTEGNTFGLWEEDAGAE